MYDRLGLESGLFSEAARSSESDPKPKDKGFTSAQTYHTELLSEPPRVVWTKM